ncbi:MAG TPA: GH3 auxin-responsive promoter family protein [Chitinophagales bacterium]|nr:GH3 auxin-responsive promoter family protein [Chitinophagales bacterium]HNI53147.1 GH3 auxin-responsive promoter family protein [Chitinophagales bacterium]HNK96671.1 GH3 auxin-responsive promoter family protein [Chitinophagales bacterium]
MERIHSVVSDPIRAQDQVFQTLIDGGRDTVWGKQYDYASLRSLNDLKNRFPVQDYDTLKPYIDRIMQGEQQVLWHSHIAWFAKSSGTTSDKSKFIPVSSMALEECHFRGGRDVIAMYLHNNPESKLFDGKSLLMGGSHQINKLNQHSKYGDVSAVMMQNLPWAAKYAMTPSLEIALMDEWESKIEAMAHYTKNDNVTSIAGVPTWTIVLIRRLFELCGTDNVKDIWPNLELYIHGGVSFKPYRSQFNTLIRKDNMHYVETYNASEGFFAFQDRLGADDMLLMPDYGLFYEFIPMEEFDKEDPKTLSWGEVELGKNYAVVVSSNAGLWRYKIGDTIRFTSLYPHRVQVSGRVKHFINAFGEEVIVDNSDKAIAEASAQTGAKVVEYTAAPIYISGNEKGGHEWIIEFSTPPENIEQFTAILDATLKSINSDYEAKRHKDLALKMPVVHIARKGAFYDWLKSKGKLGGQHKIPRLSNERTYVDEILKFL